MSGIKGTGAPGNLERGALTVFLCTIFVCSWEAVKYRGQECESVNQHIFIHSLTLVIVR